MRTSRLASQRPVSTAAKPQVISALLPAVYCCLLIFFGLFPQFIVDSCGASLEKIMKLRQGKTELVERHSPRDKTSQIGHVQMKHQVNFHNSHSRID